MIQSPCTITLTPQGGATIVLIAAGGWLEALPAFEASQELYETDGIQLGHGFFRPLGGVAVSLQLALESDHEDLLEALEAHLGEPGAESLLQVSGSLNFVELNITFPDSVVTAISPDLPSGPTSTVIRTLTLKTSLPN